MRNGRLQTNISQYKGFFLKTTFLRNPDKLFCMDLSSKGFPSTYGMIVKKVKKDYIVLNPLLF